jgi:tRNA-specific 2-thiouridylase
MGKKALIAMSGGVDSSVAAWLMLEQGWDCAGVTLKLFDRGDIAGENAGSAPSPEYRSCCSLADVNDAREVARRLGIPHYVLNFSADFKERVMRRFVESYESGVTPNPCIDCNRFIKFDRLMRRMRELDFDCLVTGHYARIEKAPGRWLLKKALDSKKDQSYVLYAMTQEQLAAAAFPLGSMTKRETRKIALERNFCNAEKQDSQDICFVPGGDYGRFIEAYTGRPLKEGNITDGSGTVLGRHRGQARYTIGQRRGLGLSFPIPMYVSAKSAADNTVTLGPEESLYAKSLVAEDLNLIACGFLDRLRVTVKTRYLQTEQRATVEQIGEDRLRIDFDEPQRALTAGQAAVIYQGDVVIGGGTIREIDGGAQGG